MTQDNDMHLSLDLRNYWIVSAGYGLGALHDEVCVRDPDGLPYVPGRHLRGLLRHAVACLDAPGAGSVASILFGGRAGAETSEEAEGTAREGCLRVDSAELPSQERAWFRRPENREKTGLLYRTLYATAVESETGTAANRTLRTIEVAVPLRLEARIRPLKPCPDGTDWKASIRDALPLIRAVGKHRHAGMGRVVVKDLHEGCDAKAEVAHETA